MTGKSQKLAHVALNKSASLLRGLVYAPSGAGPSLFAAMAGCQLVVDSVDDINGLLEQLKAATRLIVLTDDLAEQAVVEIRRRVRAHVGGHTVVIAVLSDVYSNREVAHEHRQVLQVDLCLPRTAPKDYTLRHFEDALSRRRPLSDFRCFPADVAREIDDIAARIHVGTYYEFFNLEGCATSDEIRAAFHQVARYLHPDRHRKRLEGQPEIMERIAEIYKRVNEAHSILVSTKKKIIYDLGILTRASKSFEPNRLNAAIRAECDLTKQESTQLKILEALKGRLTGDWQTAFTSIKEAVAFEPNNTELAALAESITKVYMVTASHQRNISR